MSLYTWEQIVYQSAIYPSTGIMRTTTASALAFSAFATLTSAGNVNIDNMCNFSVWLTTDQNGGPADGPPVELPPQSVGTNAPVVQAPAADPAQNYNLNIADNADMNSPFSFGYSPNMGDSRLYYSFSTITGDPLAQYGFEVLTNGNGPPNPAVHCEPRPNGGCCQHAFTYAGESPAIGTNLYFTNNGADFTFRLCASSDP